MSRDLALRSLGTLGPGGPSNTSQQELPSLLLHRQLIALKHSLCKAYLLVTRACGNESFQLGRSSSDVVISFLASPDLPIQWGKNKPLGYRFTPEYPPDRPSELSTCPFSESQVRLGLSGVGPLCQPRGPASPPQVHWFLIDNCILTLHTMQSLKPQIAPWIPLGSTWGRHVHTLGAKAAPLPSAVLMGFNLGLEQESWPRTSQMQMPSSAFPTPRLIFIPQLCWSCSQRPLT